MKKFKNVRLKGQKELVSILVEDGKIKKIAQDIPEAEECETIDLGGHLVVPPYVDPHLHLDYVFNLETYYNQLYIIDEDIYNQKE